MRKSWTGFLAFKQISIPVEMYNATQEKDVKFSYIHKDCNTKLKTKRFCENCKCDVEWGDVTKGYEVDGKYIPVDKDELEEAKADNNKRIEIHNFVNPAEIGGLFYQKSYYIKPAEGGEQAFIMLKDALEASEKVAVATFVMRNKQHLVVLKPYKNIIVVSQMFYQDEIVDTKLVAYNDSVKADKEEVKLMKQIIEQKVGKFDLGAYKDEYREAVENLIEEKTATPAPKTKGKGKTAKTETGTKKVSKLMGQLTASLK